ncbi:hypothetical protein HBA53_14240 [Rhodococcus pyridinivorans]|uniref:reverse transcriptase domain-containing protein n=1 Tax=Rhodococcus TaxID=1827 RepID=UPI001C3053F1|nr:hypothetical protein [Rhodococcus sp. DMU2021]QXF82060.1 hypothetical protein HBA53_14240 [Rhodococcus pyridinivorans]
MNELAKLIKEAASKKISVQEQRRKQAQTETVRRQRRSTLNLPELEVREPATWAYHPSHNPFHVRARAASIGHAIDLAIKSRNYAPLPPAGFQIPKANGKHRTVTSFSIADEVVSKRLYSSLINKNRTRLSARSYAYRKDLNINDAISHIQSEWRDEHRIYLAEYDFTDYFGSIDHDQIWSTISRIGLSITRTERHLLRAFMQAPQPTILPNCMPASADSRSKGIHQGTTISLLLANIVATPFDRELERLGVSFTRYADDIVIWSRDYGNINRAVDELHRFAERIGCQINHSKSRGVSLLTSPDARSAELLTSHHTEFLSHRISLRKISLSDRAIANAKHTIEEYIYNHLLREPLRGSQDLGRLRGNLDRDYIALLSQLRRYLYGSLSEEQLRRLLRGPLPSMISLGGLLGRHPMVDDVQQLRALDRWMSTQIWLAMRKRERLLSQKISHTPQPWGYTKEDLYKFTTRSSRGSHLPVDGRVPSAVRMNELVRRAVRAHGTRVATHTTSLYRW